MTLTNTNVEHDQRRHLGPDDRHRRSDHEQHDQEPEHRPATPARRRSPASASAARRSAPTTLGTRNDNNTGPEQQHHAVAVRRRLASAPLSDAKNLGTVITGNTLGGAATAALGRAGVYVGFDDGRAGHEQHRRQRRCGRERRRLRHRAGQHRDHRQRDSRRTRRRQRHRDRQLHRQRWSRPTPSRRLGIALGTTELRHEPDREQLRSTA